MTFSNKLVLTGASAEALAVTSAFLNQGLPSGATALIAFLTITIGILGLILLAWGFLLWENEQ